LSLEEFSNRFISALNWPSGKELDDAVKRVLGAKRIISPGEHTQ